MSSDVIRVVHIYPHLLGTYGDAGNSMVLVKRIRDRGLGCELLVVHPGDAVPAHGDIYLLGGGEDAKQTAAAQELRADGSLVTAARRGAVVLGVCAGYQLLGETFLGVGGVVTQGLGLLDVRTDRLDRRAVGNVLAEPEPGLELPQLVGFENHGGSTALGSGAAPLARVLVGVGNGRLAGSGGPGDGDPATEGAVHGNVYGTYLHGPVLALNPGLADRLIASAAGVELPPLDDVLCERLRTHRLRHVLPQTARAGRRRGLVALVRRRETGASGAAATLSATAE